MFVSVVEPALQTSSNSLFAFIFCNLIILIILLGSKFSSSDSETQDALPGLHIYTNAKPAEIVDVEQCPDHIENENEDAEGEYEYESENEDNGEEDNVNDDELRRRIEDFITKVNREWKEENFKDRRPKLALLDQPLALITQEA